jgi:exopolyphosphatase/guanosine-5'-triphosphate,3'-diphosphate pyrophosphatase
MHYAVVDIGTNSARLMIAHAEENRVVSDYKTLRLIRVGEDMLGKRRIVPGAMVRTRQAIIEFLNISRQYDAIDNFFCFATSAVRDAENKTEFLNYIRRECGTEVDIISGGQEALLGFAGCIDGFGGMFDIGGGSTEVMAGRLHEPRYQHSFQIGTVRLLQKYPTADFADAEAFDAARSYIRSVFCGIPEADGFVYTAIGGTATALAAIDLMLAEYDAERVHQHVLRLDTVTKIESLLMGQTKEQRKQLIGLEEMKADVIVFGAMICSEIMKAANAERIVVSDSDNLEGYLKIRLGFNQISACSGTPSDTW